MLIGPSERRVAELLACYDFRLEADRIAKRLGVSDTYVRQILRKLREKGIKLWPQHVRDIRPLGLVTLVIYSKKPLGEVATLNDLANKVPLYRYFYSYRVTLDNKHIYSYVVPREFAEEAVSEVSELGEVEKGVVAPVYPCSDIAAKLPGLPETYRPSLLDLLIYALLDLKPLATIQELTDINIVYEERLEARIPGHRLSYAKLLRAYQRLSSAGVVGRTMLLAVHRLGSPSIIPLYIRAKKECYAELYQLVAETMSAPSIFVGEESVSTVMVLGDDETEEARRKLGDCILYSGVITHGVGTTLPVEMYDPFSKKWVLEPMDLPRLVEKLGYLAR
jgi:DNA-binding Lrp family transcriptional regulator